MSKDSYQLDIPESVKYKKYVDMFLFNDKYVSDKLEYFTLELYYLKYSAERELELAVFKETYNVYDRKDDEFNTLLPKEYYKYKGVLRNSDNNITYQNLEYTFENINRLMSIYKYPFFNNQGLLYEYKISKNIIYEYDNIIYYNNA